LADWQLLLGIIECLAIKLTSLPRWKENIILFLAVFAGQGSSIFWVAIHRGYHHPHADTERDLHSPKVHGIWHAFAGWFKEMTENNPVVNPKYAVDLMRKSNHVWFHNYQQTYSLGSFFISIDLLTGN
jgi:fatty-acid desaturase